MEDQLVQTKEKYVSYLKSHFQLYSQYSDEQLVEWANKAVEKAIERGVKFGVLEMEGYLEKASEIYFKHFIEGEQKEIRIPSRLAEYFWVMEEGEHLFKSCSHLDIDQKLRVWSEVLNMDSFQSRLVYFSHLKFKKGELRQVDIDLATMLLPPFKRGEYEIFQEKLDRNQILEKIKDKLWKN
ncbi:CdiA family toxin C-terminal domain-containing protein [Microaerobacter geothermalis]|uniref:CdiA family toxin C-terminal domain-containing protein n=1 Tax=Microaerobacter geothermalis TaxID=674972 RepID=UPI001F379702|nr:CdiA family toxin C-terminal domain-containing protein [Microaerobacter geothermalis]MCF6094119.1 CdiA family toxin C-terminal domain-containing protein [Microaerobacter geothermalis]